MTLPLHAQTPLKDIKIVIDPGHGTLNYSGRIINSGKTTKSGSKEHFLNIQIGAKLKAELERAGATVVMTRDEIDYWREAYSSTEDNKARAVFANELKADAYLSIHCDWHPHRKVHGITTIYTKPRSWKLGKAVHRQMIKQLKARDRRVIKDSFTVLDHAEMPAIIIETGFMSHRRESKKLTSSEYQTRIAKAITSGVKNFFNTK